ncbi:sigma-70 family RNA polymerase sigma factor [Methylorubrum suomiense]|uniref:RNA polymerase sigma factor n=1 Tax=Methylorubrum suomiense TaxID=144191 RepID=A0ABQ4UQS1_9HYPH|nr:MULTISPECIES: sigma-70 family RNA polymerase sigma factor [Methylobacteriaceae]GJE74621.1 ECF RNA polymerase sigma factor SigK [Methylorubrum suomiense]
MTSHEGADDGADALLASLLARIAGGDEAALRALYDQTAAKLLGIILRIQRDRSLAEDVLQDVYLRIWHAAGSYVPTAGAPLSWLCAIARNRAIDGVRRRSEVTMPSGESGEAYWERLTAPGGGEDAILDRDALVACLSRLDPTQRDCVVLAYCEGWSREELAARYDRPVNTVKTWLHRTLASLKSCLETIA